ncbi:ABC transporter ATP-binding protein [Roseibium aggregatum]|uniref:ATP-binding cassette domain-containing protein n=1 Tax=Roseibium aggregatum TaxID=187304 RepID=A0A939J533_9HYPH|nr:ATP-binding cassette domain-containing protein [Roseibium aggregatum]MBN9671324.1 ATP-binding cassette domain-containing protein [Roseibium aggregatum]
MIEIDNVSFRHGVAPVLQDVTLLLPKGGLTALVGPNGAGKSTLFSLMARLLKLQSGEIRFDGMDVATTTSMELARKIAILRQDTHVTARLTVRDLIGFGRFPHHRGRPGPDDEEMIEKGLELFELSGLSERYIDELSGGQRQRALVAMAYVQDTDYLLLDEPLNNLDMHFARTLMKQLRYLADRYGKTIVVVLHDINYAAAYADRIVALKDGRLSAQGTPEEIMTADCLGALFDMEIVIETVRGRRIALHHAG